MRTGDTKAILTFAPTKQGLGMGVAAREKPARCASLDPGVPGRSPPSAPAWTPASPGEKPARCASPGPGPGERPRRRAWMESPGRGLRSWTARG